MLAIIFWLLRGGPFRNQKGTFSCGHVGDLKGLYKDEEHSLSWNLHPDNAARQVCITCAIEASILCCYCEGRIYPGNAIAVYAKSSGGINWDVATELDDQVIGCLRSACCPSGAYYAGPWTVESSKRVRVIAA